MGGFAAQRLSLRLINQLVQRSSTAYLHSKDLTVHNDFRWTSSTGINLPIKWFPLSSSLLCVAWWVESDAHPSIPLMVFRPPEIPLSLFRNYFHYKLTSVLFHHEITVDFFHWMVLMVPSGSSVFWSGPLISEIQWILHILSFVFHLVDSSLKSSSFAIYHFTHDITINSYMFRSPSTLVVIDGWSVLQHTYLDCSRNTTHRHTISTLNKFFYYIQTITS